MQVLRFPPLIKWLFSLIVASSVLSVLEVGILTPNFWWDFPGELVLKLVACTTLILSAVSWHILSGRKWAYYFLGCLLVTWSILNIFWSLYSSDYWLSIFTVLQIFVLVFIFNFIRNGFKKSYFDPQTKWYQKTPSPIPRVTADVFIKKEDQLLRIYDGGEFKVGRLDDEGTYLFLSHFSKLKYSKKIKKELKNNNLIVSLKFNNKNIYCQGKVITFLASCFGVGISFFPKDMEEQRSLQNFIEELKGDGYVC